MKKKDITVKLYDSAVNNKKIIVNDKLDGLLKVDGSVTRSTLENSDPTAAKGLQMKVQQVIAGAVSKKQASNLASFMGMIQAKLQGGPPHNWRLIKAPQIKMDYLYGDKDTSFFDVLGPILVGFFVFFFVFLILELPSYVSGQPGHLTG